MREPHEIAEDNAKKRDAARAMLAALKAIAVQDQRDGRFAEIANEAIAITKPDRR